MDDGYARTIAFEFALPVLAALFPTLDTAGKEDDPLAALRTRECALLWLFNIILAVVAERVLFGYESLPYSFYGFLAFLVGFPMILQSKIFTVRLPNSTQDTSIGFELFLQIANRFLIPGIRKSIQEADATLLGSWLTCDVSKLGNSAKNYVTSHDLPPNFGRTKEALIQWIDSLVQDAIANPGSDVNLRTLYLDIYKIGGTRGVRWIVNNCKKP